MAEPTTDAAALAKVLRAADTKLSDERRSLGSAFEPYGDFASAIGSGIMAAPGIDAMARITGHTPGGITDDEIRRQGVAAGFNAALGGFAGPSIPAGAFGVNGRRVLPQSLYRERLGPQAAPSAGETTLTPGHIANLERNRAALQAGADPKALQQTMDEIHAMAHPPAAPAAPTAPVEPPAPPEAVAATAEALRTSPPIPAEGWMRSRRYLYERPRGPSPRSAEGVRDALSRLVGDPTGMWNYKARHGEKWGEVIAEWESQRNSSARHAEQGLRRIRQENAARMAERRAARDAEVGD